jgi:polysaccharide export outer membrane protein
MKRISSFTLLLFVAVAALPAAAQSNNSKTKAQDGKTAGSASNSGKAVPQAATTDPSYVIGPSDQLNISVWEQPELSREVPVRPDGMISLPLLNDVQAAGKTPMQLASTITEKLSSSLVKDPQVTVIVTLINSQRVYIMGKVGHAGSFPLVPGMTVLQAISTAGDLTLFAKQNQIYILRTENGKKERFPFNYKDVLRGMRTEQDIVLKPGDLIVVP